MTPTKRQSRIGKAMAAMGLAAMMVLLPTVAHAEGSFTSSISQGRPGFQSRSWEDYNRDGVSTSVTLSGCKANLGGQPAGSLKITSLKLTLYKPTGVVSTKTLSGCGTFSWGDLPKDKYWFRITSINGKVAPDRVFLNASTVSVKY